MHSDLARRLVKIVVGAALVTLAVVVVPQVIGGATGPAAESSLDTIEPLVDVCAHGANRSAQVDPPDARVDVTGDGCADLVRVDGTRVEINGVLHRVGLDGDRIALRDEDCDGIANVHVHRPSTGEHFVFDRLPEPGTTVRAQLRSVQHEPGGGASETDRGCTGRSSIPSPATRSTGDPP